MNCRILLFLITIIFHIYCSKSRKYNNNNENCYSINLDRTGKIYDDYCYFLYESELLKMNFNDARKYCKENFHPESDLVKVDNVDVNNFLNQMRKFIENVWIGLHNEDGWGWKWIIDETTPKYFNWDETEPDGDGYCAEMWNIPKGNNAGTWNDIDCSHKRRFFCIYKLYSCYNTPVFDVKSVCSGHGTCVNVDKCECNYGYIGNMCSKTTCNGMGQDNPKVCNQQGICVDLNVCDCIIEQQNNSSFNYYGVNCNERISLEATLDKTFSTVEVEYIVAKKVLKGKYSTAFDCLLLFKNDELGIGNHCNFEYYTNGKFNQSTSKLIVHLGKGNTIELGSNLLLIPVTSVENKTYEILNISIVHVEEKIFHKMLNIAAVIEASLLLSLVFISCCCLCICLSIIFCISLKYRRSKEELDYYHGEEIRQTIYKCKGPNDETILKRKAANTEALMRIQKSRRETNVFNIKSSELNPIGIIKNGKFWSVFLALWKNQKVVLKSFPTKCFSDDEYSIESFEIEVTILGVLSHPNILRYYGCVSRIQSIGIVTEYCDNKDLCTFIMEKSKRKIFTIQIKMTMIFGICSAMEYLHSNHITHCSLTLDSILLDSKLIPKIHKFGACRRYQPEKLTGETWIYDQSVNTSLFGTYYSAPEIILHKKFNEKNDIFSFGIICYEIYSGSVWSHGRYGKNTSNILSKIAGDPNFRPHTNFLKHKWMKNLLISCWDNDPKKRPTFDEITLILKANYKSKKSLKQFF